MQKLKVFLFALLMCISLGFGNDKQVDFSYNEKIYGAPQIEAIKGWGIDSPTSGVVSGSVLQMQGVGIELADNGEKISGIRGWRGLGEGFTILQNKFFAPIFFAILILVPLAFFGHNRIVGVKRFDHHGRKFKVFSKYNIIVHWGAAIPFVLICITGLMMMFGDKLGGGMPIRLAKNLHFLATWIFLIFGILMFLMWVKPAMFKLYDIGWLKIMGGYLSNEKREVPAGKFNAGQKMWFWLCTLGGFAMAITGLIMHYFYGDINTLRLMAIIHNVLGFGVLAMLITHIYMAVFAIEGAIEAILNGHMAEEELALMHSYYYKELIGEQK
ncbi:formate dehydrogenase subunit gamma [Helicobacter anseris]|uniref:Formate dehydrogenase subunit gamma n=1 Tax=Helicobacter anseris TaxID=375926 RepID=A0A3D8J280_9HELI|nr:formate dehydrogenase subunit gamma [Helicobacter anseris]RDU71617.1 formate dehydrogenase subunit gamma [Helicobacter anseris]